MILVYNDSSKRLIEVTSNDDLEEVAKKIVPNGVNYKIIDESELPIDKTNRYAWYLDEDDTIKVDQSKLEAEKTLATGLGFIQFTKKRLEIENVANDIPPIERVQIFQAIKDKLSNWKNEAYKNYWDFLEQMQTPFIENTWNVFKNDISQYKDLEENLYMMQTSQGEKSLGDILLFYISIYESENRCLSKEEFIEKYT